MKVHVGFDNDLWYRSDAAEPDRDSQIKPSLVLLITAIVTLQSTLPNDSIDIISIRADCCIRQLMCPKFEGVEVVSPPKGMCYLIRTVLWHHPKTLRN